MNNHDSKLEFPTKESLTRTPVRDDWDEFVLERLDVNWSWSIFKSHFVLWLQKCESDVLALSQIIPFLRFEILKIESLKIIFSTCVNQKRKYGKENAQRTWTRRQTKRWDHKLSRFCADNYFKLTDNRYLSHVAVRLVSLKIGSLDRLSHVDSMFSKT